MDTLHLVDCLARSLDSDVRIRKAAEEKLEAAQAAPGYGVALARIILAKELPDGTRHLAAVLLKQLIKEHWQDETATISQEDKAAIRELSAQALADPSSKIRTAVGVGIAKIASSDWPENWPQLLEILTSAIKERKDPNLVQGALRCLSLFAGDIDEQQIPVVLPVLLPQLHVIAGLGGKDGEIMQRRAISIVHSFLQSLGVMSGMYPRETQALVEPHLRDWMDLFLSVMASPVTVEDMDHWGAVIEAVKATVQFLVHSPNLMDAYIEPIMSTACNLLLAIYPVFSNEVIAQYVDEAEFDSDGDYTDLQMLVSQVFELIVAQVTNKQYAEVFQSSIHDLMYLTIGYMQMTHCQVQLWMDDPNSYLATESEELFTARVSGEVLVNSAVEAYGNAGISAVMDAANRHMQESLVAKSQGKPDWWKCREAAITCIGHISEGFSKVQGDENQPPMQAARFLEALFENDVGAADPCPYLVGRGLSIAGRLAGFIPQNRVQNYMQAAVLGLKTSSPPPVQIGACSVVQKLVNELDYERLKAHLPDIYGSLKNLLEAYGEEMQNLVLETLADVITADRDLVPQYEPYLTPLILKIWSENMNDPLFGPPAIAVIEAFCENEACIASVSRATVPTLSSALSSYTSQGTSVVERSLDLLIVLVKPKHAEITQNIYLSIAPALFNILNTSDDPGILQSGTQLLQGLARVGGEELLSWGNSAPNATLNAIMGIIQRILSPELGDAPALYIGQLVNCLIQSMPGAMMPCLPQLLEMLVAKLHNSNMSQVKMSLLLVFSRMVHMNVNELVDVLSSININQKDGTIVNGLEAVMSIWTERNVEITGARNIRHSITALVMLLKSGHSKLNEIMVRGNMISLDTGVRTRSRTKSKPDQWTMVPVPVKIFLVLVDMLMIENEGGEEEFLDELDDEGRVHDWDKPLGFVDGRIASAGQYLARCAAASSALDDEPCDLEDPIAQIDLIQFISSEIRNIAGNNPDFLRLCTQQLNPAQTQLVQEACT